MATRQKRDSVAGSSKKLGEVNLLPSSPLQEAAPERPAEPASAGPGSRQRKPREREERSEKPLSFEHLVVSQPVNRLPDGKEAVPQTDTQSPPPPALPADLQDSFRQMRECCLDVRKQLQTVWAALQSTTEELNEVKERSLAVKQELRETQNALGILRNTLETSREDLQDRYREAKAHFFSLGEGCRDLHREVQGQIGALQSKPEETTLPDPISSLPAAKRLAEQPLAAEEPGSQTSPPLQVPAMELQSETSSPDGKKLLGVTVDSGAVVVEILPDTPAEKAGLRLGDLVVSLDDKPITSSEDLRTAIEQMDSDQDALLAVARGEEIQAVRISLSKSPTS